MGTVADWPVSVSILTQYGDSDCCVSGFMRDTPFSEIFSPRTISRNRIGRNISRWLGASCSPRTGAESSIYVTINYYVTINESTVVNAPVDKVWARIGKSCDVTEWMNSPERGDCKNPRGDGGPSWMR
jgi:hypothetical protein